MWHRAPRTFRTMSAKVRLDGEVQRPLLHKCAVDVIDFLEETLHARNEIDRVDRHGLPGRL
jgi:hypothetical protein